MAGVTLGDIYLARTQEGYWEGVKQAFKSCADNFKLQEGKPHYSPWQTFQVLRAIAKSGNYRGMAYPGHADAYKHMTEGGNPFATGLFSRDLNNSLFGLVLTFGSPDEVAECLKYGLPKKVAQIFTNPKEQAKTKMGWKNSYLNLD